jgi:hypothetical protein
LTYNLKRREIMEKDTKERKEKKVIEKVEKERAAKAHDGPPR